MTDDINDIIYYYNSDPDREHTRLDVHQLEFELTWRYLDLYLPPRGKILEVGAATGRYTLGLAQRGYEVTAVDLSTTQLEKNSKTIADHGLDHLVQFLAADVRNLNQLTKDTFTYPFRDTFDAVLMMGPLYHLFTLDDRKIALGQAFDCLHTGGRIFTSFISRYGIMGDLVRNVPEWIEDQAEVQSVLERGKDPELHPPGVFRGYFADPAEIIPLHESMGFQTLILAGVEPGISADDESYNRLEGKRRQLWLDLLFKISTEPSTLGASRHLLYIGQK